MLIFHVNPVHNTVHLRSGAASLACAFPGIAAARRFCLVFCLVCGVVCGVVALLGFAGVTAVTDLLH